MKPRFIKALNLRGFTAEIVGGKLRVKPKLPEDLYTKVRKHRDEILLELAYDQGPIVNCRFCGALIGLVPYPDGDGWHWSECEQCGQSATYHFPHSYVLVDSKLLGEVIAVGSDCPRDHVGYSWPEIRQLQGADPELVKRIHEIKRKFPGATVEHDDGIWFEIAKQQTLEAAA